MPIDAKTTTYAVLGNPVSHSLSPFLHNSMFQKFGLNAVYLAYEVEKNSLGLAFEAIRALDIKGVNLTIPFKEDAMNFIDEIPEDLDRCVGALNTIVNRKGILYGYNTDCSGFLIALKEELNFYPEGKKTLVLGAGGAARAVCFSLAHAHADKILILNRTQERAIGLVEYMEGFFPETEIEIVDQIEGLKSEKIDLVVNATSAGMLDKDPLPLDLKHLSGKPAVYDLIYAPRVTQFLKQAAELGMAHANGLGMLANQAALAFELWTGRKDAREPMLELVKKC